MASTDTQSILVVGGGISGMTAAIEAAEAGYDTYVVERNPYLGGRVAQLHNYFPKLCPPLCGLEINFRRIKNNSRIRFFTLAEVESGWRSTFEGSKTIHGFAFSPWRKWSLSPDPKEISTWRSG